MIKLMAKIRFDTPTGEREETLYHNIVSVDIEALDRGNVTDVINWGVYANRGSLSFIDRNGTINGMLETLTVLDVKIYVVGSFEARLLATMDVSNFSYNLNTEQVDLELSDKIEKWQSKKFGRYFPFSETSVNSLAQEVFVNRLGLTTDEWLGARDGATSERMANIKVYCPDIKTENVWSAVTQLCETAMLRVSSDRNGKPYIASVAAVSGDPDKPIIIRSRNILSPLRVVPRIKTKVNNIDLKLTNRTAYVSSPFGEKLGFTIVTPSTYSYKLGETTMEGIRFDKADSTAATNSQVNTVWILTGDDYNGVRISGKITPPDTLYSFVDKPTITLRRGRYSYDSIFQKMDIEYEEVSTLLSSYTPHDSSATQYDGDKEISVSFEEREVIDGDENNGTFYAEGQMVLYGRYYEDKTDDTNNSNGFSTQVASNSLMQTHNEAFGIDYGEWYVDDIDRRYGSGVVCCELECGFSDYYYEDGTIAKRVADMNSAPQVFNKYEVVRPYVTRGGVEVPLATYQNGSPMSFVIIGIKYHYAGIAKQTLYLQEYKEV